MPKAQTCAIWIVKTENEEKNVMTKNMHLLFQAFECLLKVATSSTVALVVEVG
jgi:hypothetical protein